MANNPRTKFEESIIENRLTELFGTGSGKTEEALQSLITMVNEMQSLQCTSEGQRGIFKRVTKALDKCRDKVTEEYCLVEALFAAGVINLPTYQNFLRMKREQEEEPPAKAS